jgi:hypothetical protein
MDPDTIQDYILLLIMVLVFGVPAVAIAARLAIRPIVDAIVRLREISGPSPAANDARVAALEAEVSRLGLEVERLTEADTFNRQLNAPNS